jgi:predicted nucleotidyltransferase
MARDWETWLRNSIGPASDTEEADRDRTEKRIRDAIQAYSRLAGNVRVFAKGSYANNTNVRRDSDVDIAVEWKSWAFISKVNKAANYDWDQLGVSLGDSGPATGEYRQWVEEALIQAFGTPSVDTTGNKAITVTGGSTTLDADVVPCFRHKEYMTPGQEPAVGTRLYPKNGGMIENWPDQQKANGNTKNANSGRRYKQIIRAFKRLENDMVQVGQLSDEVHGYFIECLLYNLPNDVFQLPTYKATALDVLARLWRAIEDDEHTDWVEVNGRKWLWRGGQTWTPGEASNFAYTGWNYIKGN